MAQKKGDASNASYDNASQFIRVHGLIRVYLVAIGMIPNKYLVISHDRNSILAVML